MSDMDKVEQAKVWGDGYRAGKYAALREVMDKLEMLMVENEAPAAPDEATANIREQQFWSNVERTATRSLRKGAPR